MPLHRKTKKNRVFTTASSCDISVLVCTKKMLELKFMRKLYLSMLQKRLTVCALLPKIKDNLVDWSREEFFQNSPEKLKPLFADEEKVFQEQEYFFEEDQELRRFIAFAEEQKKSLNL